MSKSKFVIYKYDELDINDIKFCDPVKNGRSYGCKLNYLDNDSLRDDIYIQSPVLKCVSSVEELLKTGIISLEVPINQLSFYIWFQNLDKLTKNKAHLNSLKWFNKNIPKDIIENYYKDFIGNSKSKNKSHSKNDKYIIKFKLPFDNDILQCNCYNESNVNIELDEIVKDINIAVIINISKLIFKKQQFYLDIKVSQLKIYKELYNKYKHLTSECIIDDEDSDDFDKSMIFDEPDMVIEKRTRNSNSDSEKEHELTEDCKEDDCKETDLKEIGVEIVDETKDNINPVEKEDDKDYMMRKLQSLKDIREQTFKEQDRLNTIINSSNIEYNNLLKQLNVDND
jgi:hypothetical protein